MCSLVLLSLGSESRSSQEVAQGGEAQSQLHSFPSSLRGHIPSYSDIQVEGELCRAGPWDRTSSSCVCLQMGTEEVP